MRSPGGVAALPGPASSESTKVLPLNQTTTSLRCGPCAGIPSADSRIAYLASARRTLFWVVNGSRPAGSSGSPGERSAEYWRCGQPLLAPSWRGKGYSWPTTQANVPSTGSNSANSTRRPCTDRVPRLIRSEDGVRGSGSRRRRSGTGRTGVRPAPAAGSLVPQDARRINATPPGSRAAA